MRNLKKLTAAVLSVLVCGSMMLPVYADNAPAVCEISVAAETYYGDAAGTSDSVVIDETNFPDDNFRTYVSGVLDSNKDSVLSAGEIQSVRFMMCTDKSIKSLKGIEFFTSLNSLYCYNNKLTEIDVSNNTALTYLNCSQNQLTKLDVSNNKSLGQLICDDNQLTELNVSGNTSLYLLSCKGNNLTSLDVSNSVLTTLACGRNRLTSLKLNANNTVSNFSCSSNVYYIDKENGSFPISKLPNGFDSAKASEWDGATYDKASGTLKDFTSDIVTYNYNCGNGKTVKFVLKANPDESVEINSDNFPDTIFRNYVTNNFDTDKNGVLSAEELKVVSDIIIDYLNVESLKGIEYFTNLMTLSCKWCKITELDLSKNVVLTDLNCFMTKLDSLDVSNNMFLAELNCNGCGLKSLDLNRNTDLELLDCSSNNITSLDLSQNTALTSLTCWYGDLAELKVSGLSSLKSIICYDTKLDELDLSSLSSLTSLNCGFNKITSLDLSHNNNLSALYCSGNQLTSLDLSASTYIGTFECLSNIYRIEPVDGIYPLSKLPEGFDPSKVIKWEGAEYDSATNSLKNFTSMTVTYEYDCGKGISVVFALKAVPLELKIDKSAFPDDNFREFISENIDKDKNGILSIEERESVTTINVNNKGIESLEGIEYFSMLNRLVCSYNKLTSLDISQNTALRNLDCRNNQITVLDFRSNSSITFIYCSNNLLTSLDLSGYTDLSILYCDNNKLTNLDVCGESPLYSLNCSNNRLTSLDLTGLSLPGFDCENNCYTIDVSSGSFPLSELPDGFDPSNVIKWEGAEYDSATNSLKNITSDTITYIYNCGNVKMPMFTLKVRSSDSAEISSKTFPDDIFRDYVSTNFDKDKNGTLSPEEIDDATIVDASYLGVQSLEGIGYLTRLRTLSCRNNKLTELDLGKNKDLIYLDCAGNQLTGLDMSGCTNLYLLNCSYNRLTRLDVSKNTALTNLNCVSNQLTSLDVSNNTALTLLDCGNNQLTSLDVSNNTALTGLDCGRNRLTSLDISNNTVLNLLYIVDNKYYIGSVNGSYPLSKLPEGFDASKASNWSGADYDSATNSLVNFTSDTVTYDYDCGKGQTVKFTLVCGEGSDVKVKEITVNANNVVVTYSDESTKTFAFDDVTEALVDIMKLKDIQLVIDFVNCFTAADKDGILTDAQIKAIDYVLAHDLG